MNLPKNREATCCFSGYNPEKLSWGTDENDTSCKILKTRLRLFIEKIYDSGIRHFICGMARGCDMYFCEAALEVRERRSLMTLEAAIACEEQAAKWSEPERTRYFRLIESCDYETLVSRKYSQDCVARRNRYMVDNSAVLLAVYDGRFGSTMQTLEYAVRSGLTIIKLEP